MKSSRKMRSRMEEDDADEDEDEDKVEDDADDEAEDEAEEEERGGLPPRGRHVREDPADAAECPSSQR